MLRPIRAELIFLVWSSLVMRAIVACHPKKIYNVAGYQCECGPPTTTTSWRMHCFIMKENVDESRVTKISAIAELSQDDRVEETIGSIRTNESRHRKQRVIKTTLSDGSQISEHLVRASHKTRRAVPLREVDHVNKGKRIPLFSIEFQPRSDYRKNYLEIVCDQGNGEIPRLLEELKAVDVVDVAEVKFRSCPLPKNLTYGEILNYAPITRFALYSPILEVAALPKKPFEGQSRFLEDFEVSETRTAIGLQGFEAGFFESFSSLSSLTLRRNQLDSTESLQTAVNLTDLNLSSNRISELKPHAFRNLTKLKWLQLVDCKIEEVREGAFSHLENLSQLDLTRNHIAELPPSIFNSTPNLASLSLSVNPLAGGLAGDLFSRLGSLENLSCSDCDLRALDGRLFAGTASLTLLRLDRNQLRSLPVGIFNGTRQLRHLKLSFNKLEEVREDLLPSSLETLDLSWNKLKRIPKEFFQSAHRITDIDLRNNLIDKLERATLSHLTRLRSLKLSNNLLSALDPFLTGDLISLKTLDLSRNLFVSMPFLSLNAAKSFSEFNLRGNRIRSADLYLFHSDSLRVDLSDNPLETIRVGGLRASFNTSEPGARREYVLNSPLRCDCHLLEFLQYVRDRNSGALGLFAKNELRCENSSEPLTSRDEALFRCHLGPAEGCPARCRCISAPATRSVEVDCAGEGLETWPELPADTTALNLDHNRLVQMADLSAYPRLSSLSLRGNRIESAEGLLSRPGPALQRVSLADNRIARVAGRVGFRLELAGNQLQCDCSSWEGLRAFFKENAEHLGDRRHVECGRPANGTRVDDFVDDLSCDQGVARQRALARTTVVLVSLAAVLAVLATALYHRNRQRIIVYLYNNYYGLYELLWREGEVDSDKPYDAFVSYSERDADLVAELVEELERVDPETGEKTYRLCVHYRDWIAGHSIVYNIVNSVQNSRRTVLVLSEHFISSEWLNVEFKAAFTQMMEDRSHRLILVVRGELPSREALDGEIQELLKQTHLKWGSAAFWDNLRYLLPHKPQKQKPTLGKNGHPMVLTGYRPSSASLARAAEALDNEKNRLKSLTEGQKDVPGGRINAAYVALSSEDISVHCDSLGERPAAISARPPLENGVRPPRRKDKALGEA